MNLDELLNKYRTMGDRVTLAKILNPKFPEEECRSAIVKLRNNITHKNYYPTDTETDKLFLKVESCFNDYYAGKYYKGDSKS